MAQALLPVLRMNLKDAGTGKSACATYFRYSYYFCILQPGSDAGESACAPLMVDECTAACVAPLGLSSFRAAYPGLTSWAVTRLRRWISQHLGVCTSWQRDVAVLRLYVRDFLFPQNLADADRLKAAGLDPVRGAKPQRTHKEPRRPETPGFKWHRHSCLCSE